MDWNSFRKWFNRDFWRAFSKRTFPIEIPKTVPGKADKVRAVFESIRSSRYSPSIPEAELVMNKGCGVARTVPVFSIDDYIVYYFCIKELEAVVSGNRTANTFGGWTLGGQLRRQEETEVELDVGYSTSRYAFNPRAWTVAFGEFNSLLFAQLGSARYTHVIQFDLSNFYDSVRLDILERWIREDARTESGWVIALLFYFLNQWNRRNTGLHPQGVGIPQDALADCSRLLANYYLQRYDKVAAAICSEVGCEYFRYSDDQMVLINGVTKVEPIMLLLTRQLDRYGLRVNQKKVAVWTIQQLQRHRCRDIHALFANPGDNRNPRLVRKFVDSYLQMSAKQLANSWNGGFPLLNRLLWANIESLPQKLFNRLLSRLTSAEYLLRAEKDKLLRIDTLNGKRTRPIDLRARLTDLGQRTIHNAFHYECLGFARERKARDMITFFSERIASIANQMETNRIVE